jgi:hypothetical protein
MKHKLVMYHGERPGFMGTIRQLFKTRDGEEMYWVGRKRVWFGHVYEITHDDKMAKMPKEVEVEDWKPTDKEEKEYEAQKLVCRQIRADRQKEMKIKKPHENIVRAIGLLRPFYRALDDNDRRRFMKWVGNECGKKKK